MDRKKAKAGWIGIGLLCAIKSISSAHEMPVPKADHLNVSSTTLRLEIRNDIPGGFQAEELRSYFDRDHNKMLDAKERGQLQAYLELASTQFLEVTLDGKPLKLKVEKTKLGWLELPLPTTREITSTFILTAPLPVVAKGVKVRTLTLKDRHKDNSYPVGFSLVLEDGITLDSGRFGKVGQEIDYPAPAQQNPLQWKPILLRYGETVHLSLRFPEKSPSPTASPRRSSLP